MSVFTIFTGQSKQSSVGNSLGLVHRDYTMEKALEGTNTFSFLGLKIPLASALTIAPSVSHCSGSKQGLLVKVISLVLRSHKRADGTYS